MPELSSIINGKKFMWDCVVYETKKEVEEMGKKYKDDGFEIEYVEEEGKHFLFTRRAVTEIVVEGEAPA
jgi:hypothetical protein